MSVNLDEDREAFLMRLHLHRDLTKGGGADHGKTFSGGGALELRGTVCISVVMCVGMRRAQLNARVPGS